MKNVAPVVGFFEILVWLVAVGQVIQHLDEALHHLAFAGGYATGTWLGLVLEERLALGLCTVRIITAEDAERLVARLGESDFGLTTFSARGLKGKVRLILMILRRQELDRVLAVVRGVQPRAFVSVSDVRLATEGFLSNPMPSYRRLMGWLQKK